MLIFPITLLCCNFTVLTFNPFNGIYIFIFFNFLQKKTNYPFIDGKKILHSSFVIYYLEYMLHKHCFLINTKLYLRLFNSA